MCVQSIEPIHLGNLANRYIPAAADDSSSSDVGILITSGQIEANATDTRRTIDVTLDRLTEQISPTALWNAPVA